MWFHENKLYRITASGTSDCKCDFFADGDITNKIIYEKGEAGEQLHVLAVRQAAQLRSCA